MKTSNKTIRKTSQIIGVILITILTFVTIWWFLPERTPSIHNNKDHSISQIDYINIGGIDQCVLLRGNDIYHPIILFLHGGPGMPMMYLAH